MISFESRDPQSYYFKKHMEDMMGFDSVCTLQLFEPHLEKPFFIMYVNNEATE